MLTLPPFRARPSAGFTLSELLVALAVSSIIVVLVYQVFVSQQRVYTAQEDVAEAQQNARVAVDELTRTVSPLGAGAAVEEGQVRILMAHPDQLLFNGDLSGDHDALAAGTDLTGVAGYSADDPYSAVPGSYASAAAETYRYYLRPDGGVHHSLYREINLNPNGRREVAMHLGNQRVGQALFSYYGDFDGNGTFETLERVDSATSSRVAAGAPLDAVIRRIDLNVIAETPFPDPRVATNGGYRQTVLRTSITPRNVYDCPIIQPVPHGLGPQRAPVVANTSTIPLGFRVTRGAIAEQGRRVLFSIDGPSGFTAVTSATQGDTDPDGYVDTRIDWPPCPTLLPGTYTVTATTSTPPSLDTPFGTCSPHTVSQEVEVIDGEVLIAAFTSADPLQLATCGDDVAATYELLDGCGRVVHPDDVAADLVWFVDTSLGGSLTPDRVPEGEPTGTVNYQTDPNAFAPGAARDPLPPHPFTTTVEARSGGPAGPAIGSTDVEAYPLPDTLSGLTANLSGTGALFSDCPSSVGLNTETFQIGDTCGNPVWTLNGSYLGTTHSVEARLDSVYPGGVGGLTSTNNAVVPLTPVTIRENTGVDGEFDVTYSPPTCGLGDLPRDVELLLTPSWDPGSPAGPVAFQVAPCTSCSVQVLDPAGTPTTSLNRECEPEYDVVVTHCKDPGATVELVLEPIPVGGTTPSFAPNRYEDRTTPPLSFDRTTPPGEPQQATARLYMGWADANSRFRIVAYMPDQASFTGGLLPSAVMCQSDPIDVDTSCEEILISDSPDNRGGFPTNSRPEDVPICALEGSEVYFRVKDCDQNWRDYAADDLTNLAGSSQGILVEAVDRETRAVLDIEEVDDLFEVDQDGIRRTDEPYFQGSLLVTQDPDDPAGSGLLRVPEGRVVELRATYRDPNDPSDTNCEAFALLVPPLPVCLPYPVASFGGWEGELTVLGGDAVVAGDLALPLAPRLVVKEEFDPLDRFFNAYVGGQILVDGVPAGSTGPVGQPLDLHPNYFQRVPDTAALLTRLDYGVLKALAKARRVYWEPDPTSGLLVNPFRADLLPSSFQQITQLPGPGLVTSANSQGFLFVDAPAGLQSAAALDNADLADLPRYPVTGDFFTEGLIYVAGSVDLGPVGGGQAVPVEFAATRDARYDEADGGFTRPDLPLDFDPATGPAAAGTVPVNWNGVLYAEGEVVLEGAPVIHGVLSAERGVRTTGDPEVWYDPQWLETRLELCSECCGLALSPASPTALLGDTLQLTANRPQGQVVWESLDPQVALVDDTGEVETLQEGSAVIRATDAAGCVAEVEVTVICGLTLDSSGGTSLIPGDVTGISASAAQGTLDWVSDNPAAVELDRGTGVMVIGTAMGIGGSQVTATDTVTTSAGTAQCSATLDFVVNCPAGNSLSVDPADPALGTTVDLAVVDALGSPVGALYTFFADGATLAGASYTPADLTPVEFTAALPGNACPLGPVTVSPRCPDLVLSASPSSPSITDPVTLSVREAGAENDSIGFTFTATPETLATVAGDLLTPLDLGTVTVSAVDSLGCAPPDLALSLSCPGGRSITTDPATPAPGDTVTLGLSSGNVGDYEFTADGNTVTGLSYIFASQAPVTFGATLTMAGGGCQLSATATPVCKPATVVPGATNGSVGDTIGLTVVGGSGTDVTGNFTFAVNGPGSLTGSSVVLTDPGAETITVQVSAVDVFGCTADGAAIQVTAP